MAGKYRSRIYRLAVTAVLAAGFLLPAGGCGLQAPTRKNNIPTIAPETLRQLIENGRPPLIIDVRSEEEFREGHIPGAVNIPYTRDFSRIGLIASPPADRTVVIYCRSGRRTRIARSKMVAAGLENKNIITLRGHFPGWRSRNFPRAEGK